MLPRTGITVRRRAITVHRAIRHAHREGGWLAAARQVVFLVGELAVRPIRRLRELQLDRSLHVDTGADTGSLHPAFGAASGSTAVHDDAVGYSPIPVHHFRRLIRRLPITRPERFTFVDLGCGKGRTLVLAAGHGFGQVVGVELDPRLSAIATGNALAYAAAVPNGTAITVVTDDAVGYRFPDDPCVVFLFNPFGAATLKSVLANLESSLVRTPRRIVIAYFNPVQAAVLDATTLFERTAAGRDWAVYETAP